MTLVLVGSVAVATNTQKDAKAQQKAYEKIQKEKLKAEKKHQKQLAKELKNKKDVLKDAEYKEIKTQYFNAEGYGDTYNCKVAQQRFCKVKDLDTVVYVLCDREVSRTQMESAKIFYELGRCIKLN